MILYKTIWAIYDTEEQKFVSINNKAAWTKAGNAKLAFKVALGQRFDNQFKYKLLAIDTPT